MLKYENILDDIYFSLGCNSFCGTCFGPSQKECYSCASKAIVVLNKTTPYISTECTVECSDGYYNNGTNCLCK